MPKASAEYLPTPESHTESQTGTVPRETSQLPYGRLVTLSGFHYEMGIALFLLKEIHFLRILFHFSAYNGSTKTTTCRFTDHLILHRGTAHSVAANPGAEYLVLVLLQLRLKNPKSLPLLLIYS